MTPSTEAERRYWRRIHRTMFKEKICSEHGAACFLEAKRRERAAKRLSRAEGEPR